MTLSPFAAWGEGRQVGIPPPTQGCDPANYPGSSRHGIPLGFMSWRDENGAELRLSVGSNPRFIVVGMDFPGLR